MKQIHKSKTALFGCIEKCTNPPNRSLTQLSPTQSHALPNFLSPPTFSSTKHNKTKKTHLGSRRGEWNDMKCGISLELSPQKSSVESIRVFFLNRRKNQREILYMYGWLLLPLIALGRVRIAHTSSHFQKMVKGMGSVIFV